MSKKDKTLFHQLGDSLLDDELNQTEIIVCGRKLAVLTLSEGQRAAAEDVIFHMSDGRVYADGEELAKGQTVLQGCTVFLFETAEDLSVQYIFPPGGDFLLSKDEAAADLVIETEASVLFARDKAYLYPNGQLLYFNDWPVAVDRIVPFRTGDRIFVSHHFIERREEQWQISALFAAPRLHPKTTLVESRKTIYQAGFPHYHRSPRILPTVYEDEQRLEKAPLPPTKPKNAIWRALIPPLGMIALSVLLVTLLGRNGLMMITMGGMSVLTATFSITGYFSDKKEYKQKKKERAEDYQAYLLEQISILHRHFLEERAILSYRQPHLHDLMKMIRQYDGRLYERLPSNEDFMALSLGLGEVDSQLQLVYQSDFLTKDDLTVFSQNVLKKYEKHEQAPVTTNLAGNVIGLVAQHDTGQSFLQQLLLQIAAFHSYQDVIFVHLLSPADYRQIWRKWRFLPHFQMPAINIRSFVYDERSKDAVLTSLYQILQARRQEKKSQQEQLFLPQLVIAISDDRLLSGHAINEHLSSPDLPALGVTVIWLKESRRQLSETVTTLIEVKNSDTATLVNNQGNYVNQAFRPYPMTDDYEMTVRSLSNLVHEEKQQNALPDAITFLEMYGAEEVAQLDIASRWARGDTSRSLAVPLGVRGKDDLVSLNLHERAHGPHGLIAGTTGSGKSEILQSYILSLSLNFSPEDIGFLPIDFKGGGMANLFKRLPHLMGRITNLDGAGTQRALASIRAELQKRQRLFGQFGVNHINGYTKLYKE
ncbi:FtsK/SpoIIIE domain-containing protein, partial [Streptococcus sp. DD11]|uniref:FtsK/SpoIIIE domain-containing protein n=1 Tax=Streptococcus sp. DD11 TaxID=1777879 RepID=UPI0024085D88